MVPPFYFPRPPFAELLWTLNIEWWLYMLFGWLVIFYRTITKLSVKRILVLLVFSLYPSFLLANDPRGTLVFAWFFGVLITDLLTKGKYVEPIRKYFKYLFPPALILSAINLAIDLYHGVAYYEVVLEFLVGCTMLLVIFNFNGRMKLNGDRLKRVIKTMAGYSYTLYLLNMVIIGALLAFDDVFRLQSSFPAILVTSLALTNIIAFVVAYFTEMRYKAVARWIKRRVSAIRLPSAGAGGAKNE